MKTLLCLLLIAIFLFIALVHIYWGVGGKKGAQAAIPTNEKNEPLMAPGPFACFLVAFALIVAAVIVMIQVQWLPFDLPYTLSNYGLWTLSIVFLLRAVGEFRYVGFFKRVKGTRFGKLDSLYYSPLCLFIGLLSLVLAIL